MTITAKNYAAQAQRASIGISAKNSAHKAAIYMARTLHDAQHFALPDGGKVLDDGLRGLEGARIDADAVAYHNGAWTSKPPSSRSPSLE